MLRLPRSFMAPNIAAYAKTPVITGGTWNPADMGSPPWSLDATKRIATTSSTAAGTVRSITSHSSGKWAWRFSWSGPQAWSAGIESGTRNDVDSSQNGYAWYNGAGDGHIYHNGAQIFGGDNTTSGTVIVCVDLDTNLIWFFNPSTGAWNHIGTNDPSVGVETGGIAITAGTYFAAVASGSSGIVITADFTTSTGLPTGYSAWG